MELIAKKAKVWNVWVNTTKKGGKAATIKVSSWIGKDKDSGDNVYSDLTVSMFGEDAELASTIKTGDKGKPVEPTYVSFRVPTLKITNTKTSGGWFHIVDTKTILGTAKSLEILEAEPRKKGYGTPTTAKPVDDDLPF